MLAKGIVDMFWKYFSFREKILQDKCPLEHKLYPLTRKPYKYSGGRSLYVNANVVTHVIFMILNILLKYLYPPNFQIVYKWFFRFFLYHAFLFICTFIRCGRF